jgi:hypothetical protein
MKATAEQIYQALFDLVCTINTPATPLATMSRRWRKWDESGILFPAFYQMQTPGINTGQERNPRGFGLTRYELKAALFFYFEVDTGDTTTPISTTLNAYYNAIDLVLQPSIISAQAGINQKPNQMQSARQQLGGQVGIEHCYIDGIVQFDEGLVNPPAMLVFPITIVTG